MPSSSPRFGSPSPICVPPQLSLVEPCIGCMLSAASPWDNVQISIKGARGARKGGVRGTCSCDTSWLLLPLPSPIHLTSPPHTHTLSLSHTSTLRQTDRQTDRQNFYHFVLISSLVLHPLPWPPLLPLGSVS